MHTRLFIGWTLVLAGCAGAEKTSEGPNGTSSPVQATTSTAATSTAATTSTAAPTATPNATQEPAPGARCGEKTCAPGETCKSYYGIAGARGPQFHDCIIPCKRGERNDGCPEGKHCSTIADGPGDVCQ